MEPRAAPDRSPGLLRRLAAGAYDLLLVTALLICAAVPLPFLPHSTVASGWGRLLVQIYLGLVCTGFFCWFWVHGGQTLGMRAWRLRVVTTAGTALSWPHALRRCAAAVISLLPLGLGVIWAGIDRHGLAWHDRLSGTRLILLPRISKPGPDASSTKS